MWGQKIKWKKVCDVIEASDRLQLKLNRLANRFFFSNSGDRTTDRRPNTLATRNTNTLFNQYDIWLHSVCMPPITYDSKFNWGVFWALTKKRPTKWMPIAEIRNIPIHFWVRNRNLSLFSDTRHWARPRRTIFCGTQNPRMSREVVVKWIGPACAGNRHWFNPHILREHTHGI